MNFKRHASSYLKTWKSSKYRKPLVLRGARQVGKTTLIKEFANSFKHFISLNLEKPTDTSFFESYDDVGTLVEALFLNYRINPKELGDTLLFIDEIQELPKAIQSLRYFYEEVPQLNVVAAGSLLEFAMKDVASFPVGRIENLHLYPLNFQEYLEAIKHPIAVEELNLVPLRPVAHKVLLDLFHRYAIIGGMPEIVRTDIENETLAALPKFYESIWGTYKNDVEKYASNPKERTIIKFIMETAPLYMDQRVKFQNFGNSGYGSRDVAKAFRNLDLAKIIQIIYPTTDMERPIKPDLRKSPRLQFLDTGLVNYTIGIQAELLSMEDLSPAFKGAMIPHIITQELISLNTIKNIKPHFWVRDKKQATAEVDLLFQYADKVIPIEVKSGATGSLRSLHQFMDRSNHPYAVRMYAGEFKIQKSITFNGTPFILMNLPYYLGTKLPEYIEYLLEHHGLEQLSPNCSKE